MLHQFRISHGTITRASDRTHHGLKVPECDLIIWDPSDLPAIFEKGDFAIVPNHSVRGLIEVKRTCNKNASDLINQLEERQSLLLPEYQKKVFGIVFRHPHKLFMDELTPNWIHDIGATDTKPRVTRLFTSKGWEPDLDGIFSFIYFLSQVAGHTWPPKTGTYESRNRP